MTLVSHESDAESILSSSRKLRLQLISMETIETAHTFYRFPANPFMCRWEAWISS